MRHSTKTYVGLGIVFLASFAMALFLPVAAVLKNWYSIPAVAALVGALFQIFRDEAEFERQRQIQREQQYFGLGTASHMADLAFDKHVQFCEEYMEAVHEVVDTFFLHGPTEKALEHCQKFAEIRRRYAAWIPKDVASRLRPFEDAVNRIGALSEVVDKMKGDPKRKEAVSEMFSIFKQVMLIGRSEPVTESPEAAETVKEQVRSILGVEELTTLRGRLVQRALRFMAEEE